MKVSAPSLLPILRSPSQARLLTVLLLAPEREFTLTDLAEEIGVSLPTVSREIARAEEAGIVSVREIGPARPVRADTESVLYEPLSRLLLLTFGPATLVAEELSGIEGVEEAYLFGSWAARYEGVSGPPPEDLDVLVVGEPDRDEIYRVADRVERRLGRPVQVTIRSPRQWARAEDDPFLGEVQRRPLVQVLPPEEAD